jgi:hypothetical protein
MTAEPGKHTLAELVDLDADHDLDDIVASAARQAAGSVDLRALAAPVRAAASASPAAARRRPRGVRRRPEPTPRSTTNTGPAGASLASSPRGLYVVLRLVAAALIVALAVAVVVYIVTSDRSLQFTRTAGFDAVVLTL